MIPEYSETARLIKRKNEIEQKTKIDLDDLKCLRMSEASDQFEFLDTLATKHNELVAFLAEYLAK